MLAKKFKLPIQNWFKERKKADIRRNGFFVVKFRLNNLSFGRFGVLISSKTIKNAAGRNKIKRIIFDFVRLKKLHLFLNQDVLITVLPAVAQLTKLEIEKELKNILN